MRKRVVLQLFLTIYNKKRAKRLQGYNGALQIVKNASAVSSSEIVLNIDKLVTAIRRVVGHIKHFLCLTRKRLYELFRVIADKVKDTKRKTVKHCCSFLHLDQIWLRGLFRTIDFVGQDTEIKEFLFLEIRSIISSASVYHVVRNSEKTTVYIPSSIEMNNGICYEYDCPELYIAELKDVYVVGETNIIGDDNFFYNNLVFYDENRIDISYGDLICHFDNNVIVAARDIKKKLRAAICLVQAGNYNYYHFFIETLSRLVLVDEVDEYRKLPILVDSVVMNNKNFCELLHKCNKYGHEIIWIGKNEHYTVEHLIYASSAVFMPGNLKNRELIKLDDFMMSGWLLRILKSRCQSELSGAVHKRRIFVSRKNTTNSRLINEKEVIKFFVEFGFDVVFPEELSVSEQSYLFASADIIVATSGAAMANILFCEPGTTVVCIIPREHNFYLYSSMANLLGMNYKVINADIVRKAAYPGMDEFKVDIKKLKMLANL